MIERILVLGATGDTGKLVVEAARHRGLKVNAAARDPGDIETTDAEVRPVAVDVMEPRGLPEALNGVDAVISTLGVGNDPATLASPPPLYTDGHMNVVNAMEDAGLDRLICVSALWSRGNDYGPLWFRAGPVMALTRVYSQMRAMERQLGAHPKLRFTAVRAGYLQDDAIDSPPPEPHADRAPEGCWLTRRADLAEFLVTCAVEETWIRKCPCFAQKDDGKVLARKTPSVA
ncbi:NAD(P)-dependent oxidoreductase [Pontivivens ytuae]|uniref:NAD(P)H-binding protein n=1 Tax=Pontivivens ytuae TaxID=2789856 RepID=A0A7S9LTR0_9RHOB|nr:NAD(P)H-binding protein [Pontivivens ytuae]QPH55109.1 NAD(P)H-binding protein [Pontivivens ytuae]